MQLLQASKQILIILELEDVVKASKKLVMGTDGKLLNLKVFVFV